MSTRTLVSALLLAAAVFGQASRPVDRSQLDLSEVRRIPVLSDGRFKPFDAYAREIVTAVTGSERPKRSAADGTEKRMDPMFVYLQWVFDPEGERKLEQIAAPDAGSRKIFAPGRGEKETAFSYDALASNAALAAAVAVASPKAMANEPLADTDREILSLYRRVAEFGGNAGLGAGWEDYPPTFRGGPPLLPPREAPRPNVTYSWTSIGNIGALGYPEAKAAPVAEAWSRLGAAWMAADAAAFTAASSALRESIAALDAPGYPSMERIDREVRFNLVSPFQKAAWMYVLTAFLAIVWIAWKKPWFGFVAATPAVVGLGYHAFGSVERTALSGQALIGNLYESLLFVAGAAMVVGLVFELIFRSRWALLASSLLAWIATRVALDNPLFMPPSIARLRPVLINNFWIHIHVPTMMLSYATLGVAALMAHVWLVMRLFRKETHPELRSVAKFVYWIIPPGVILLFAGIILGGIWADASWGRFWGWDPKETWAFLSWLVFVVVIHGRWSGWLRDFGTAIGSVIGGLSLLMTYYGVNFFLSGLHSYAGASADSVSFPLWLAGFLTFEVALVAAALVRRRLDGSAAPAPAAMSAPSDPAPDAGVAPLLRS